MRCDNAALTKLSNLESVLDRVASWISFLSDLNYEFKFIKSRENIVTDVLSMDSFVSSVNVNKKSNTSLKSPEKLGVAIGNFNKHYENSIHISKHSKDYLEDSCQKHCDVNRDSNDYIDKLSTESRNSNDVQENMNNVNKSSNDCSSDLYNDSDLFYGSDLYNGNELYNGIYISFVGLSIDRLLKGPKLRYSQSF